jgi:hypothetical protein
MEISPEDFKPEPEYKPMDLAAEIAKLIKKAEERVNSEADKVPVELLAALKLVA